MVVSDEYQKKVNKLYTDMYLGDGKENPSMTVRMSLQEEKTDSISRNMNRLMWISISTLLSALGGLIMVLIERVK